MLSLFICSPFYLGLGAIFICQVSCKDFLTDMETKSKQKNIIEIRQRAIITHTHRMNKVGERVARGVIITHSHTHKYEKGERVVRGVMITHSHTHQYERGERVM